jgi:hypothetical protein
MTTRKTLLAMLFTLAIAGGTSGATAFAGEICCVLCGCHDSCQKVCRLVCEEKKVDVICWGVKCEDFCLPGPSRPCCKQCDMVCDECSKKAKEDDPQPTPHRFVWRDWIPSPYATIHTKRKLMQRIDTKTVPSYKWVVEDLCKKCESKAKSAAVAPGIAVPPIPQTDAKILLAQAQEDSDPEESSTVVK